MRPKRSACKLSRQVLRKLKGRVAAALDDKHLSPYNLVSLARVALAMERVAQAEMRTHAQLDRVYRGADVLAETLGNGG